MTKARSKSHWSQRAPKRCVLATLLVILLPSAASAGPFTIDVGPTYDDCLACYVDGALADINSAASKTFYEDHYTNTITDMLSGANISLRTVDNNAEYGEYRGATDQNELENIYIATWLLDLACACVPPAGYTEFDIAKARELLQDTIGHELVHWADMHDDGTNNNGNLPAGTEEGAAWEMAVYGKVKTMDNATGAYTTLCPEPATLSLAGLGLCILAGRFRKNRNV